MTLTGTVDSYGKKVAAREAAHRVRGVLDVANDITVNPGGGTTVFDTEIARAVREAFDALGRAAIDSHIGVGDDLMASSPARKYSIGIFSAVDCDAARPSVVGPLSPSARIATERAA